MSRSASRQETELDPQMFTTIELKKILKQKGLKSWGLKKTLINRLKQNDPSGIWMQTILRDRGRMSAKDKNGRQRREKLDGRERQSTSREIEMYQREKELTEELHRNIELPSLAQRDNIHDAVILPTGTLNGDLPNNTQTFTTFYLQIPNVHPQSTTKSDEPPQSTNPKVEHIVHNCILAEKEQEEQEEIALVLDKKDLALCTFYIDHLGPLAPTEENYKHIFVVTDSFSKFAWLYAIKSMDTAEVLNCLKQQATQYGNPKRIISDRGIAFTSEDFEEYCKNESIKHILKTTEVLRANEQLMRINQIIIPFLTAKSEEWYKYLSVVQRYLNTKIDQNIMTTPYELLFGVHPRYSEDDKLQKLLEYESVILFQKNRVKLRMQAAKSIAKLQEEN